MLKRQGFMSLKNKMLYDVLGFQRTSFGHTYGSELLTTPGFENGGAYGDWLDAGGSSISTTTPHAGTYNAKGVGIYSGVFQQISDANVAVGAIYKGEWWTRVSTGTDASLEVVYHDSGYNPLRYDTVHPSGNTYAFYTITGLAAPAGTAHIQFYGWTTETSATIYIDDCSLKKQLT